jgi:hypothetical protein
VGHTPAQVLVVREEMIRTIQRLSALRTTVPTDAGRLPSAPAPPPVHVTIGRIDVRTPVPPPPAVPARQPVTRRAGATLDADLAKSGGSRP